MIENPEILNDLVQTLQHPFQQAHARPGRTHQHRYERRRIRECLRRHGWHTGNGALPVTGLSEAAQPPPGTAVAIALHSELARTGWTE